MNRMEFKKDLEAVINKHSMENGSNTPDWVLTEYLISCLDAFDQTTKKRDTWYDIAPRPGWTGVTSQSEESAEDAILTVLEITKKYLIANQDKYDGLANLEAECGCPTDDLALCGGEHIDDCEAAHKIKTNSSGCGCGDGCDFHLIPGPRPGSEESRS